MSIAPPADVTALDPSQLSTFREFLSMYNRVSDLCFRSCVWDFTSRTVKDQEDRCSNICVEKFMKSNQRISQRFQEAQIVKNEAMIAQAPK